MQVPIRKPGKYAGSAPIPLLTPEKVRALQNKLKKLKAARPELAAEVARHAEMGDFSENAEYQHAKWQLRRLNSSIEIVENRLNHAIIIEKPTQNAKIGLGHTVRVRAHGKEHTFQILGGLETNPKKGIISQDSPVGRALIGCRVGETAHVSLANKKIEYEILEIK